MSYTVDSPQSAEQPSMMGDSPELLVVHMNSREPLHSPGYWIVPEPWGFIRWAGIV